MQYGACSTESTAHRCRSVSGSTGRCTMNSRIALPIGGLAIVLLTAAPCGAQQPRSEAGVLAAVRTIIHSDHALSAYVEAQDSAVLRRDYIRCDANNNCEILGHQRVLVIRVLHFNGDTAVVGITTHVMANSPSARRADRTPLASRPFIDAGIRRWTFVYSSGVWTRTKEGGITS